MTTLADLLAEHPFLKGMDREHLDFLSGCALNVVFNEGEYLYREGVPVQQIYLLRHGRVAIRAFAPTGPLTVDVVGPGNLVGWSGLVDGQRARFDAVAIQLVRAIALDARCLRAKCEADPALGFDMLGRVADVLEHRLEAARVQLLDLYGSNR